MDTFALFQAGEIDVRSNNLRCWLYCYLLALAVDVTQENVLGRSAAMVLKFQGEFTASFYTQRYEYSSIYALA